MKKNAKLSFLLILLSVSVLFLFTSCSDSKKVSERYCFGTLCSVTLYGKTKDSNEIFDNIWSRMSEIENHISANIPDSTVGRFNAGESVSFDSDTLSVLDVATRFYELTGGALSPYLGAVTELWGIGTENARVPSAEEIQKALTEKKLDLGAYGKGYAADEAAKILRKSKVSSALINFGGNICCVGCRPDGKAFRIGLQDPDGLRGTYSKTVDVTDGCVVTSGSYERFFCSEGVTYCHIFDAGTGMPVQNGLKAVAVTGPEGIICDALSTACFILGEKDSYNLLAHFPEYSVVFDL